VTAGVDLVTQALHRHARVKLRGSRFEACHCGWRSETTVLERHQAAEILGALERQNVVRRTGRQLGDCEHGAPNGGRNCIECRLGPLPEGGPS
jgi:hypothetical protein